ncbi:hypothetical protein J6590_048232 [Homalodisca vitripennis]|nr:hypothetical protein J6590_048232 [Homalodisca vitripennis]
MKHSVQLHFEIAAVLITQGNSDIIKTCVSDYLGQLKGPPELSGHYNLLRTQHRNLILSVKSRQAKKSISSSRNAARKKLIKVADHPINLKVMVCVNWKSMETLPVTLKRP